MANRLNRSIAFNEQRVLAFEDRDATTLDAAAASMALSVERTVRGVVVARVETDDQPGFGVSTVTFHVRAPDEADEAMLSAVLDRAIRRLYERVMDGTEVST